uniref:Viral late gene transcription factor 3 zinc ribbon domain-containing protein n=1 Tax=viral metagenome TaxID=1070528 RepID=A0A6C0KDP1_9ZZZZ
MNIHRLKKDLQHTDTRSTVQDRHILKMKEFAPVRNSLRSKEVQLRQCQELREVLEEGDPEIAATEERISKLSKDIASLTEDSREINYFLKASPYLCPSVTPSSVETDESSTGAGLDGFLERTGSVSKGNTYTQYMENCFSVFYNQGDDPRDSLMVCRDCNVELVYNQKDSELACIECGKCQFYQNHEVTGEFRDDVHILSPFAYKRMTHLKEYLSQIQAKETTDIPEDIISTIQKEIRKERITNVNLITPRRVRGYLKKLHLNKFYDHVNSIIVRITGTSALKLSGELECTFIEMFQQIQSPFERHCPPERKNFLSYSYTLHKMCLIIGQERLCEYFPLLKSREKNYAQDCIWRKICEELGWPFHPSV